jgi:hypothetical protein
LSSRSKIAASQRLPDIQRHSKTVNDGTVLEQGGRRAPIYFRMMPLPGGPDIPRYKTVGQPTVGFDMIEKADACI